MLKKTKKDKKSSEKQQKNAKKNAIFENLRKNKKKNTKKTDQENLQNLDKKFIEKKSKIDSEKKILLVGNPNSGKTTLFNALTHSDEHVGNWHGVTVSTAEASMNVDGEEYVLVDTPGLYSLCPLSFEEKVASDTILQENHGKVINVCDQNNLSRNLYLTLCLLECGVDVVLAVNEIDKKPIFKIDYDKLSRGLGVPVVPINAQKKINLEKLKNCIKSDREKNTKKFEKNITKKYLEKTKIDKNLTKFDEKMLKKLQKTINLQDFCKIKALENDQNYVLENSQADEQKIAQFRFDYIDELMKKCAKRNSSVYGKSKLDALFLNKFLAIPLFFAIMTGVFYLTFFSLGAFLSDLLSGALSSLASAVMPLIENSFGTGAVYDFFNVAI